MPDEQPSSLHYRQDCNRQTKWPHWSEVIHKHMVHDSHPVYEGHKATILDIREMLHFRQAWFYILLLLFVLSSTEVWVKHAHCWKTIILSPAALYFTWLVAIFPVLVLNLTRSNNFPRKMLVVLRINRICSSSLRYLSSALYERVVFFPRYLPHYLGCLELALEVYWI